MDDCEVVSRRFSDILDEKDYIEDSYIFEVSSPGLGRPFEERKRFYQKRGTGSGDPVRTVRLTDRKNLLEF